MNPHFDDPRLSAYVTGELSVNERAEIEREMAIDPMLEKAVAEFRRIAWLLERSLGEDLPALDPVRRHVVLAAAREADANAHVMEVAISPGSERRGNWRAWSITGAAAAVVALALLALTQLPIGHQDELYAPFPRFPNPGLDENQQRAAREIALTPVAAPRSTGQGNASFAPASSSAMELDTSAFLRRVRYEVESGELPSSGELPVLADSPFREVTGDTEISLPLTCGGSSWTWIRRYLKERETLPPANAVRIEEMLNAFPVTAEPTRQNKEPLALTLEMGTCPWNSETCLALVEVGNTGTAPLPAHLLAAVKADSVSAYRLVGYARSGSSIPAMGESSLAPGKGHRLLIELRSRERLQPAIEVVLNTKEFTRTLNATGCRPWEKASSDFRFITLIACYGQALRAEAGELEANILRQRLDAFLAQSPQLSEDQAEAIDLIHRSLVLMNP